MRCLFVVARHERQEDAHAVERVVDHRCLIGQGRVYKCVVEPAAGGVAQQGSGKHGGVSVVVLGGRGRRGQGDLLSGDVGVGNDFSSGAALRFGNVASGFSGGPVPAHLGRLCDKGVEVHVAHADERQVVGCVAAVEVRQHLLLRKCLDRLRAAENAMAQRVRAEILSKKHFVDAISRHIAVAGDLVEDDVFFEVEVLLAKAGPEYVAQQVQQAVLILRQNRAVEDGVLLGRERVVVGAHRVELAVDLQRVPPGCSLEDHVLQEMADAGDLGCFVACASADEKTSRHRSSRFADLRDDSQTVI